MAAYVVDASVAIKWVIAEPGAEAALALLGHELTAPDLLVAECANILWRKHRLGEISLREAGLAARLLERAEVDLVPMRRLLDRATALAIALDHPAYDAVYLALAELTGRAFVTADVRLARKAAGGTARVLTLDDFAP
ncbi:MAG: type II toxin-antitoxin system VapC family toxin [Acetobacteraceae bacterium]